MSWPDLEPVTPDGKPSELSRSYARTFANPNGEAVMADLRRRFLDREVPPSASDAELRHHEGARSVVRAILRQIEQGQK
ncbi:MAG: hypothetical protein RJA36_3587 [Pseudomonadota bacterium]|jgi:hypothetical protein